MLGSSEMVKTVCVATSLLVALHFSPKTNPLSNTKIMKIKSFEFAETIFTQWVFLVTGNVNAVREWRALVCLSTPLVFCDVATCFSQCRLWSHRLAHCSQPQGITFHQRIASTPIFSSFKCVNNFEEFWIEKTCFVKKRLILSFGKAGVLFGTEVNMHLWFSKAKDFLLT